MAERKQDADEFQLVDDFATSYFGSLRCSLCKNQKEIGDIWWCPTCVHLICSTCQLTEHLQSRHKTHHWKTMQAVVDVSHVSRIQSQVGTVCRKPGIKMSDQEKVEKYLNEVKDALLKLLAEHQPYPKLPIHECLQQFFGDPYSGKVNDITLVGNVDKLTDVADQMLKLALDGNTEEVWDRFAMPNPSEVRRLTIEQFEKTPEIVAESIWESMTLKTEVENVENRIDLD